MMDSKDRIQIIDAIRGLAIISVILLHILPGIVLNHTYSSLHIGQAVPIFLFISFYLSFKGIKDRGDSLLNYFNKRRIGRLLKQVVFPYFIVVICQMIVTLLRNGNALEISDIFHRVGGEGPGSYYLWVYLQIWLIIPFVYLLLKRYKCLGYILVLLTCLTLNYFCVRASISGRLYGLTCIRYLFLGVPAYMFLSLKRYNKYIVLFCVIGSLLYLTILQNMNLSPFVLDYGWASQQWPAYFWTLALFIFLQRGVSVLDSSGKLFTFLCWLGRNSWYIFITQMFILCYINPYCLILSQNAVVNIVLFTFLVFFLSIIPALIIDYVKKRRMSLHE